MRARTADLLYRLIFAVSSAFLLVSDIAAEPADSIGFFTPASSVSKSRVHLLNASVAGMYPLSMTWLYTQWYKDYPQSSFHFFNDNSEWLQMDKFGHAWDAYSIAKPVARCYRWAGFDAKKAAWYGAGIAFTYQTTIEVFDGFSKEWGFSFGDMISNTVGAGLFLTQELAFGDQRVLLKYSFHQTQFSKYRPDVLGSSLPENILKDYNGLTYWACWHPLRNCGFADCLGIAAGYGAEGMTGGSSNPKTVVGKPIPDFNRYRQYYLALDIDLSKIRTRSEFLRSVFRVIRVVHLPAPAIEIGEKGRTTFRPLYF